MAPPFVSVENKKKKLPIQTVHKHGQTAISINVTDNTNRPAAALIPATDGWMCLPWSLWGVCIRCRFWLNIRKERTSIIKKCMCKKPKRLRCVPASVYVSIWMGSCFTPMPSRCHFGRRRCWSHKKERKQYEHRYPNPPLLTGIHPGAASARPAIPRGRRRTECPAWPAGGPCCEAFLTDQ